MRVAKQIETLGEYLDNLRASHDPKVEGRFLSETRPITEAIPDAPVGDDVLMPPGWSLRANRLARVVKDLEVVVAHSPIVVSGRMVDVEDGTEWVHLAWVRDGHWKYHTSPRGVVSHRTKIVELADLGFPVTTDNAKHIVTFLRAFEDCNLKSLPMVRCAQKLGWQGPLAKGYPYGFLLGEESWHAGRTHPAKSSLTEGPVGSWSKNRIGFRAETPGEARIASAFSREGSLEGWKDAIAWLENYPTAATAVIASLVPPLLPIIKAPNFVLDVANPTSTGKSTVLKVAASVWGDPDERSPTTPLSSWDATAVWLERTAALRNCLPMFLDDTKRARYPSQVSSVIYELTGGQGRGRGKIKGIAKVENWHTVLITTGEERAVDKSGDGGTRARVVSLWGDPLGTPSSKTATKITQMASALNLNYGVAGGKWVRFIHGKRKDFKALMERYYNLREMYTKRAISEKTPGAMVRVCDYLGALHLAFDLAAEAEILPWEKNPVPSLWDVVLGAAEEADRASVALEATQSWATANRARFYYDGSNRDAPSGGWLGRWDHNVTSNKYIYFYPHHLKDFLTKDGFDYQATLRVWVDRNWASRNGANLTRPIAVDGQTSRMVAISIEALDGLNEAQ